MALAIELKRRLNDQDEPLCKRIRLAEDVFNSQRFPLTTRRNIILKFICDLATTETSDVSTWVESIQKCFSVNFTNSDVDLAMKQEIVSVLETKLKVPSVEVLECLICVVTHASMRQYLLANLNILQNILHSAFKAINSLHDSKEDKLKTLMKTILRFLTEIYKYNTNNNFYSNVLVKSFKEIFKSLYSFEDKELNRVCIDFIQKCIFTKQNENAIEQYIDILKRIKSKHIALCLEILTVAFANSYKNESNGIFKLYKRLFNTNSDFEITIIQYDVLVNILKNEDISLESISSEDDKETFMVFLQKCAINVLCNSQNSLEDVLNILISIVLLNPLILEPNLKEIVTKTMLMDKLSDSSLDKFSRFLQLVIQAQLKLNRVHKLPLLLLNELNTVIQNKGNTQNGILKTIIYDELSELNIEKVWPSGIAECWGNAMKGLNASVTWGTFKSLLYNLENSCIAQLTTHTDTSVAALMTQVTLRFIDSFLINCELPLMSQVNYAKIADNIKKLFEILSNISTIITENNMGQLLCNWLHTVYVTGEFTLMVKYYWQTFDPQCDLKLIVLHDSNWKQISNLVKQCKCSQSRKYLNQIILQNIRSSNISVEPSKKLLKTSGKMIDSSLENWDEFLCSKVYFRTLYPMITDSQILSFVSNEIRNLIALDNIHILKLEHIQENRKFMNVILFYIFCEIAKAFLVSETNITLTKQIFEQFTMDNIFENKIAFLTYTCKMIGDHNITNIDEINTELLISCLNALKVLNLQFFEPTEKACTFVFIISVMGDLHAMSNNDKLKEKLLGASENILLGLLESGQTFDLDQYFTKETYLKISPWFTDASSIFYPVIEMSLKESSPSLIEKLTRAIKTLSKHYALENSTEFTEANVLREILPVPTAILIAIPKMKKKYPADCRPSIVKLQRKCLNLANNVIMKYSLETTDVHGISALLPSYIFLLQSYLKTPEDARSKMEKIPTLLKIFMDYALNHVNLTKADIVQTLITVTVRNQEALKDYISQDFILDLWNVYHKSSDIEMVISAGHVNTLLENCTDEQYRDIISNLVENTSNSLESKEQLLNCMNLWTNISEAKLNADKSKIRLNTLTKLSQDLLMLFSKQSMNDATTLIIIKLFLVIMNNHLLVLNSTVIDMILGALLLIPYKDVSENQIELYKVSCAIIQSIILKRTSMVLDRLPVVTHNIRYLLKTLSHWSNLGDMGSMNSKAKENSASLSFLGHSLEKTFSALIKLKRDLSRPAYLLHDIIVELTSHTLLGEVKQSLLNCCYLLHTLCDSHALKYLNTVSSPANRQIFKNIHDAYNKFHMFKGKV